MNLNAIIRPTLVMLGGALHLHPSLNWASGFASIALKRLHLVFHQRTHFGRQAAVNRFKLNAHTLSLVPRSAFLRKTFAKGLIVGPTAVAIRLPLTGGSFIAAVPLLKNADRIDSLPWFSANFTAAPSDEAIIWLHNPRGGFPRFLGRWRLRCGTTRQQNAESEHPE